MVRQFKEFQYGLTFRNNYAQMKIDGPKSHGKVFEDDGERVWLRKCPKCQGGRP